MHIYVSSLQWNWLILMNSKFSMRFFQAVWLNLWAFSTDKVQFADNKRETPVDRSGVNLNVVNHYNGVRRETKYSANTELKCLRATQSLGTIWAAALQHDKLWQWQPANCIKPFNTFAAIHKRREKNSFLLISIEFKWKENLNLHQLCQYGCRCWEMSSHWLHMLYIDTNWEVNEQPATMLAEDKSHNSNDGYMGRC